MILTFRFFLIFTLLYTNVVVAQPTTREFLNHIETDRYDLYIYGLESGLEWSSELTYRENNIQIYCKPGDIELSAKFIKNLIANEISGNASFYEKYEYEPLIGLAMRNALLAEFPCD